MSDAIAHLLVFAAATALGAVLLRTILEAGEERASLAPGGAAGSTAAARRRAWRRALLSGYFPALALFLVLAAAGASPAALLLLPAAAASAGAAAPALLDRRRAARRRALFETQVLQLATGLSNGLRSGQAIPAALQAVAPRLPAPMSEEIAVVLGETRLGTDLPDALERLRDRMRCDDLTLLVGAIRLTTKAGGSLADVLAKMVETIRARTEFQAKLRALTAQGRFEAISMSLAPLFVFVIVFLIDRPLMLPLVATSAGWTTIVLDALWVLIGYLFIRRIMNIEV